ncbi:MAG: polysaccharide deacetylase family protein [Polaromonas sp.]|nr:polysaccharide deacetylase family protein [Polaromonas sp.]
MRKTVVKAWPEKVKIVVMVTVVQETWADGFVPVFSPMVMVQPLLPGTLDLQGESWAAYGGETGIWRILDILERLEIKSSLITSGKSVEIYPEAIGAYYRGGHEICAHSYTQEQILPYMTPDDELKLIRRCTDIIANATGEKPKGWCSPRATQTRHTAEFIAQEGYVWQGDYNDTDMPYVINTPKGKLVALMHSDFSDVRVVRGNPRDYFTVHRDMFDFLYRSGKPEIINLTVHCPWGGRPLMATMFAQVLEYFKSFEGVWFARHDEVAEWVLSTQ